MPTPILDAHLHFWDPDQLSYPWLEGALNRPFLPEHYLQATTGLGVEQAVFVECGCALDDRRRESDWMRSLVRDYSWIQGIVAGAPFETPAALPAYLDGLMQRGDGLIKGVRHTLPAGFDPDPAFISSIRRLAAYDLSFDLNAPQDVALSLAQACPEVTFILDHAGYPEIAQRRWEPWAGRVQALARCDNVHCKLSGLVTRAQPGRWTPADLRPYVRHVLAVFGVERALFGSDWPIVTRQSTPARWVDALHEILDEWLTPAEMRRIFSENARAVYRIENQRLKIKD